MTIGYQGTPGNAVVQGVNIPASQNMGGVNYITQGTATTPTSVNAGALGSGDPNSFDWTSILGNLLAGGANFLTANQSKNAGATAAGIADPFASQRGQYQTALNTFEQNPANAPGASLTNLMNLIQNPQSITSQPGYQFGMTQALDAVNRGAGASGLLNSGNRLAALQNQGQAYAGTWLDRVFGENAQAAQLGLGAQGQSFNQLASLAGVNAGSPGTAGGLYLSGAQGTNNAITGGIGGLIAALTGGQGGGLLGAGLKGLSSLFSGGGNGLDISNLMTSGGINAGSLDVGGSLGDLQGIDLGGGSGLDPGFFTGGDSNLYQIIDSLGG